MPGSGDLLSMVTGFRTSAALCVAAELGLSDELADGPRSPAELATAVRADPDTLQRLLRALASVGVYHELEGGSWENTELSEGLRSDVTGTLRPMARTVADPAVWSAWGQLGHSVRTGENAFEALHGKDVWTHRREHPDKNEIFNDYMTALSSGVAAAVATEFDFSAVSSVVDVGGGQGILLEAVLAGNDHLTGTVFDQAHVVAKEPTPSANESVRSRWSTCGGSFFDSVPAADAYLLKSILHDWPDDRCVEILQTCADALQEGGVVLVVEMVLGRAGHEIAAAFSDLNMLVLPGGRERSVQEYADLFAAAGLRLNQVVHTSTRMSVLEAARA